MRSEHVTAESAGTATAHSAASLLPTVQQLWADALGIETVAETDNFLVLGGDSLTAVRVIFAVRQRLHIEVGLETLLDSRDVAGFCQDLAANGAERR